MLLSLTVAGLLALGALLREDRAELRGEIEGREEPLGTALPKELTEAERDVPADLVEV